MNIREELQKAGPGSDGLYFNPVDVVPDTDLCRPDQ